MRLMSNRNASMIIDALKAAAPEWTFEQIRFVAGRCGAVEDDIYNRSSGRRYL